ncbi:hypothetical protein VIAE108258_05990 [Vibrio aerogenes]
MLFREETLRGGMNHDQSDIACRHNPEGNASLAYQHINASGYPASGWVDRVLAAACRWPGHPASAQTGSRSHLYPVMHNHNCGANRNPTAPDSCCQSNSSVARPMATGQAVKYPFAVPLSHNRQSHQWGDPSGCKSRCVRLRGNCHISSAVFDRRLYLRRYDIFY